MITEGYEKITLQAFPDYSWIVWTAPAHRAFSQNKHIDYEWLNCNVPGYRMSALSNILVKTEGDAMLIYLAFKP